MLRIVLAITVLANAAAAAAGPLQAQQRPEAERRVETARATAWLGISFEPPRRGEQALVVSRVHPGSPAERAGLRTGDTIVRVNGNEDARSQLRELRLQPGDPVRMRIRRAGQRDRDVRLVAAARPQQTARAPRAAPRPPPNGSIHILRHRTEGDDPIVILNGDTVRIPLDSLRIHADSLHRRIHLMLTDSVLPRLRELEATERPRIEAGLRAVDSALARMIGPEGIVLEVGRRAVAGAEFSELNPELADYFQGVREGLLVLRVAPGTPAERTGLQAGDVVVRANGETVRTTAELRRVVSRARGEQVRLGIVRKGRQMELRLR